MGNQCRSWPHNEIRCVQGKGHDALHWDLVIYPGDWEGCCDEGYNRLDLQLYWCIGVALEGPSYLLQMHASSYVQGGDHQTQIDYIGPCDGSHIQTPYKLYTHSYWKKTQITLSLSKGWKNSGTMVENGQWHVALVSTGVKKVQDPSLSTVLT